MSLKQALDDRVAQLCRNPDSVQEETLHSIRLSVLVEAAEMLRIPLDPTDLCRQVFSNRIVLSHQTFIALDKAWSRIVSTFADNHVSNQEKCIREQLFFNSPYYADRVKLAKFINILAKRDVVHSLLKTSVLTRLLAIDGFQGILPQQCRNYVDHLNDRLPLLEKTHVEATRALHQSLVDHSGTVATGYVLLALLKLYSDRVGLRMDRETRLVAHKAAEHVSNWIGGKKETVDKLARLYRKKINDDELLDGIAFKKLNEQTFAKYLP